MTTPFQCTNCDTIIEIENPKVGAKVECPICFTLHTISSITPPTLEDVSGDSAIQDDEIDSEPVGTRRTRRRIKTSQESGEYLCIPFNGFTKSDDQSPGRSLSDQLEKILNTQHDQGWTFLRIDTVRVLLQPGCIPSLFGVKAQILEYDIIIFRKQS